MKNKWILWLATLLIAILAGLIAYDLFYPKSNKAVNIFEYQLDEFKKTDSSSLAYKESAQIKLSGQNLYAISCDKNDFIYVCAGNSVVKYSATGDSVFSFHLSDTAHCISILANRDILVGMKNYVVRYNAGGKLLWQWRPFNKSAFFTSICSVDSSVFIADAGNKIVHHFDLEGKRIAEIGKKNKDKGIPGFFIPSPYFDVLLDKDGQLWAINTGRHAFEAYTKNGELITRWERTSLDIEGFSGCCNPSHVALLSDGSFVTAEKGVVRVKIHHKNGDFKCLVAGPEAFDAGTTGLDLAVDSNDRILVLDTEREMIRIFTIINE